MWYKHIQGVPKIVVNSVDTLHIQCNSIFSRKIARLSRYYRQTENVKKSFLQVGERKKIGGHIRKFFLIELKVVENQFPTIVITKVATI